MAGVCQQSDPRERCVVDDYVRLVERHRDPRAYPERVRLLRMRHEEARGPCLARERIQQRLYGGEDFVLRIDSHTMFSPGWDRMLLAEWRAACDERAVLTAYPATYRLDARRERALGVSTFLGVHGFDTPTGLPEFGSYLFEAPPPRPLPTIGWAAGGTFSPGAMMRDVPYLSDVPPRSAARRR